jgi:hypothetical protein
MIGLIAGLAMAQDSVPGSAPIDPAAPAEVANPLAGPEVSPAGADGAANKSLVERDFEGKVKKLEERPEEAALRLLTLSAREKAATDAVLAERSAMLDKLVRENINLLVRAQTAREGGSQDERKAIYAEFREKLAPLTANGTFEEQIARGLTPENAERFRAITREYWQAVMQEPGDMEGQGRGGGARVRLGLETMGQEIKRAYERVIGEGTEKIERLVAELQLTPEQQGKIREISIKFAQESKQKATGLQKAKLFLQIRRELTPEQRERFAELIREQRGE